MRRPLWLQPVWGFVKSGTLARAIVDFAEGENANLIESARRAVFNEQDGGMVLKQSGWGAEHAFPARDNIVVLAAC